MSLFHLVSCFFFHLIGPFFLQLTGEVVETHGNLRLYEFCDYSSSQFINRITDDRTLLSSNRNIMKQKFKIS